MIIAQGTPEEVAATPQSYTGQFLAKMLGDAAPGSTPAAVRDPGRDARPARKKAAGKRAGSRR
jgi:excinuclease ABC subunit A